MIDTNFEQESVSLLQHQRRAYSFWNMETAQPSRTGVLITGHAAPQEPEPQVVKCLSCGGTFTRADDGSIPCGH